MQIERATISIVAPCCDARVQLLDHRLVRERVHLEPDSGVLPLLGRLAGRADSLDQARAQPERGDEDLLESRGRPKPVR
jgi:hypothetical protein